MRTFVSIFLSMLILVTVRTYGQHSALHELDDEVYLSLLSQLRDGRELFDVRYEPVVMTDIDMISEAIRRLGSMEGVERERLKQLLAPPAYEKEVLSPTGRFSIRYDTTDGSRNVPALLDEHGNRIEQTFDSYAEAIGGICDSVYYVLVEELGYRAPPGAPYQIYLTELANSSFGWVMPIGDPIPGAASLRYVTYMMLDNDFLGYSEAGLDGARVTIAHEFHHSIQMGSYGAWDANENYIYELTSMHYEEALFPWVNSYISALRHRFLSPHVGMYARYGGGYQHGIFFDMIDKLYGDDPIRKMWEGMLQVRSIPALDTALREAGSSLGDETCRYGEWCYFTGYRTQFAQTSDRYDDAELFPLVNFTEERELNRNVSFVDSLAPLGTRYYRVYKGSDTCTLVLTNTNSNIDLADPSGIIDEEVRVTIRDDDPGAPYIRLENGWSYSVEGPAISHICSKAAVNNNVVSVPGAVTADDIELAPAYPNPVSVGGTVSVAWSLSGTASASLALYDVQGKQVRTIYSGIAGPGETQTSMPTADLAPGVYYLRLRTQGRVMVAPLTVAP